MNRIYFKTPHILPFKLAVLENCIKTSHEKTRTFFSEIICSACDFLKEMPMRMLMTSLNQPADHVLVCN